MNILISFASHPEFNVAKQQYLASAEGRFDKVIVYSGHNLGSHIDQDVMSYPRGFGYWSWKPYIIQRTLKEHPDAHVFYSDIMYRVRPDANPSELTRRMRGPCVVRWTPHRLSDWCHSYAMKRIDPRVTIWPPYLETGFSMWRADAMALLREWYFWCCEVDVVGDRPGENHRHDTAIFSLIAGKYEEANQHGPHPTLWDKDLDPGTLFMPATPEAHAARRGIGHT